MKRQLKREKIHNRLLQVGLSLFIREGYHGTGIKYVVDQARLPKGSFYTYFASKEAFAGAVVDDFTRKRIERLEAEMHSGKTSLEGLLTFFEAARDLLVESNFEGGCLLGNLSNELEAKAKGITPHLLNGFEALSSKMSEALEDAQKDGLIRSDLPAKTLGDLVLNGWEGALMRSKIQRSKAPLDQFLQSYFGTLLKP